MKKVLMLVVALLAIMVITPVMGSATRTPVFGTATLSVTSIGDLRVAGNKILHQVTAEASGNITGNLAGQMQIELNANFNLNTGIGIAYGMFAITTSQGTFEGMFRVRDTGFIHFKGSGEGHGTGAYQGMMVQLLFQGEDLYRSGYTGPDGLTMNYTGFILSPKSA